MKPSTAVAALFALVLATPCAAAESAPPAAVETPAPAAAPAPVIAARRPTALVTAMTTILESEQAAMTKLKARMASARDAATIQSIHREVEQLKLETEVQLLTVQAADHRANKRVAVAEELEAAIRSLREPQRTLEPAARPLPVAPR